MIRKNRAQQHELHVEIGLEFSLFSANFAEIEIALK